MEGISPATQAQVVSAVELTEGQKHRLQQALSRKLETAVELSVDVDPSLLGGVSIRVQGHVIDRSVKQQLRQLRESLVRRSS